MPVRKAPPLVLAHGITRPDYLIDYVIRKFNLPLYDFSLIADRFHYFKGIAGHLKKHGFEVYHTSVSFAADVDTRGRDLRREIERILAAMGHEQVHIIGHSMGGLDARHMIVNENMADKVASLTTLGTPHLGASIATWALENGFDKIIETLRKVINLEGCNSLTPAACQKFNEAARNAEALNPVFYQTFAAAQKRELTFLPFQKTWQIVYDNEGDNDGLVALKSQQWTPELRADNGVVKPVAQHDFPFAADHVNQMGWWHWNGVQDSKWWDAKLFREKKEFEAKVKNVYLQIAQGLPS